MINKSKNNRTMNIKSKISKHLQFKKIKNGGSNEPSVIGLVPVTLTRIPPNDIIKPKPIKLKLFYVK